MSSIFDILGPIMVGPSSSHTAGGSADRLYSQTTFWRTRVKKQKCICTDHLRRQEKVMEQTRRSLQVFSE